MHGIQEDLLNFMSSNTLKCLLYYDNAVSTGQQFLGATGIAGKRERERKREEKQLAPRLSLSVSSSVYEYQSGKSPPSTGAN